MRVEQLFVETLIDINQKLASNPSEYQLLRVSGLLRQILIDKKPLLEPASAAASLEPKFRLVKPGPPPIPPDVQRQIDDAWDKYIASLLPDAPVPQKVSIAFSMRGDLLSGIASQPGDKVLELAKKDFLSHPIVTWMDKDYTVENVLRVAANSLGGVHLSETNHDPPSQELRDYMEGSQMFGRSMPAWYMLHIALCTLRACQPLADKLAALGLYSAAPSEWVLSATPAQNPGAVSQTSTVATNADEPPIQGSPS